MPRSRHGDFVERLFIVEKFGNRKRRILSERQVQARDIEAGSVEIDAPLLGWPWPAVLDVAAAIFQLL